MQVVTDGFRRDSGGERNHGGGVDVRGSAVTDLAGRVIQPQPYNFPSEPMACAKPPPPVMLRAVTPEGKATVTGVCLSVVLPSPSWPLEFKPQS